MPPSSALNVTSFLEIPICRTVQHGFKLLYTEHKNNAFRNVK